MHNEENCGCEHHGEHYEERHEGDCGCGGHGHHDMGKSAALSLWMPSASW